jgi:hypothetical protein
MAHAWWHPITSAIGSTISSVGQGLLTGATNIGQFAQDYSDVLMGAGGLALVNKAYEDLEDIGQRAFTGVDPIAQAGLSQSAFKPFTVSVGSQAFPGSRYTSSSVGVGMPAPSSFPTMAREDRLQQLMTAQGLSREEAISNQRASLQKGYDLNNDGVVTDQEFAVLRRLGMTGGGAFTGTQAPTQYTGVPVTEQMTTTPFGDFTLGYDEAGNVVTINGNPISPQQAQQVQGTAATDMGTFGGPVGALGAMGPNLQIDLSAQEQRLKQGLLEEARQNLLVQGPAGAAQMRTIGGNALTRGAQLLRNIPGGSAIDRERAVFNRIRAMQSPEEERQRLALEERLLNQGRLGVQTAMFGGTPEQFALAKAQEEAQNQASIMAMQQAQQERMQQAALAEQVLGFGSGLFANQLAMQQAQQGMGLSELGAAYIPQAQALNLVQQGLAASELAQRGQLAGASMFGEAKMSGLEALLASGLGRANLIGQAGTGLLSGAIG